MSDNSQTTILALTFMLLCGSAHAVGTLDEDGGRKIFNENIVKQEVVLPDYSMVVSSRFTDSHIIFKSTDHISLIGVQLEGLTYFTVDGKDYKDPAIFEMIAARFPHLKLSNNVWEDNFYYPITIGPHLCGFWEKLKTFLMLRSEDCE